MYRIGPGIKRDPVRRWALPDRVFFACGACHILTYAFLQRYPPARYRSLWLKPAPGFTGNHIVATDGTRAFDFHGHSNWPVLLDHTKAKARRWWPGWDADLIDLPPHVLVSEAESRRYDGLWLRQPDQYLGDALARANRFLDRFPPP